MIGFQLTRLVLFFKCRFALVSNQRDLARTLLVCRNPKYTKRDRTKQVGGDEKLFTQDTKSDCSENLNRLFSVKIFAVSTKITDLIFLLMFYIGTNASILSYVKMMSYAKYLIPDICGQHLNNSELQ